MFEALRSWSFSAKLISILFYLEILILSTFIHFLKPLPYSDFIYYWHSGFELTTDSKGGWLPFYHKLVQLNGIYPWDSAVILGVLIATPIAICIFYYKNMNIIQAAIILSTPLLIIGNFGQTGTDVPAILLLILCIFLVIDKSSKSFSRCLLISILVAATVSLRPIYFIIFASLFLHSLIVEKNVTLRNLYLIGIAFGIFLIILQGYKNMYAVTVAKPEKTLNLVVIFGTSVNTCGYWFEDHGEVYLSTYNQSPLKIAYSRVMDNGIDGIKLLHCKINNFIFGHTFGGWVFNDDLKYKSGNESVDKMYNYFVSVKYDGLVIDQSLIYIYKIIYYLSVVLFKIFFYIFLLNLLRFHAVSFIIISFPIMVHLMFLEIQERYFLPYYLLISYASFFGSNFYSRLGFK